MDRSTRSERNETHRRMHLRTSPAPDPVDLEGTVRWLRDRELIKDLYRAAERGAGLPGGPVVARPTGGGV